MPPEPPKPRPRQPSRPEVAANVDKVVGGAEGYAKSQDYVRPELQRRGTLPGGVAVIPGPPALPLEGAATVPAPNPLRRETIRRPSPPSSVALSKRSDPPPATDEPAAPEAPARQADAAAELAAARLRIAQLERDKFAADDARNVAGSFPPPVSEKSTGARGISRDAGHRTAEADKTPTSSPPDAAIGRSVRWLLGKAWPFLVAAAGLGGGAVGVAKPTADPAKQDATLAEMHAMRADMAVMRDQLTSMARWQATEAMYTICLEDVLDDVGEQVLPAQDRMTNAVPLRAYIKQRCRRLRP